MSLPGQIAVSPDTGLRTMHRHRTAAWGSGAPRRGSGGGLASGIDRGGSVRPGPGRRRASPRRSPRDLRAPLQPGDNPRQRVGGGSPYSRRPTHLLARPSARARSGAAAGQRRWSPGRRSFTGPMRSRAQRSSRWSRGVAPQRSGTGSPSSSGRRHRTLLRPIGQAADAPVASSSPSCLRREPEHTCWAPPALLPHARRSTSQLRSSGRAIGDGARLANRGPSVPEMGDALADGMGELWRAPAVARPWTGGVRRVPQ